MIDLTTTYLGMPLKNPLVVSASPLSKKVDMVRRMEEAGAAAVVLYSLFEEQITHESHELDYVLNRGTHSYGEALSYFPDMERYNLEPDSYLEHLHRVKQAVEIPVIGSLNGISPGGWVEYAHKIEQAGADALELNIYFVPTDRDISSGELEENYRFAHRCASRSRSSSARSSPRCPLWRSASSRLAPMVWCCSTASTSRISISRRWRLCPA
jgi:dihydroorotate dehydrogenase (fumarate)